MILVSLHNDWSRKFGTLPWPSFSPDSSVNWAYDCEISTCKGSNLLGDSTLMFFPAPTFSTNVKLFSPIWPSSKFKILIRNSKGSSQRNSYFPQKKSTGYPSPRLSFVSFVDPIVVKNAPVSLSFSGFFNFLSLQACLKITWLPRPAPVLPRLVM